MRMSADRFCLNAATIRGCTIEQQIELAAAAGFTQIGLWLDDVDNALSRGKSLARIRQDLQEARLGAGEVCFLGGWHDLPNQDFQKAVADTERACEVATALGCDLLVAVPSLAPGHLESGPTRLRRICEVGAGFGVRIALEFPGTAAEINNVRTAWNLIRATGCENAGLLLDTFHYFLGGSQIEDLCTVPAEKIFLVHVSDAMKVSDELLKTPHDYRTFPGDGRIDYVPILRQLQRSEYCGAISLEIWNSQLRRCDPLNTVRKGFASLSWLEQLSNRTESE